MQIACKDGQIKTISWSSISAHGGVVLRSKAEPVNSEEVCLVLEVEDTGIGIASEAFDSIFQPFAQDQRQTATREGTGLGLTLSRKYARLIGGEITATSQPGQGSTFRVELPVQLGQAADMVTQPEAGHVIGLQLGQKDYHILIVDDKEESRNMLKQMLEAAFLDADKVITPQRLTALPAGLCQQLRNALVLLDVGDIHLSIEQIHLISADSWNCWLRLSKIMERRHESE